MNFSKIISIISIFTLIASFLLISLITSVFLNPFQSIVFENTLISNKYGGSYNQFLQLKLRPDTNINKSEILNSLTIKPELKFESSFENNTVNLIFSSNIKVDTQYELLLKSNGITKLIYKFKTEKPKITYLQDAGSVWSKIIKRGIGEKTENENILVNKPFITSYKALKDFLVYEYKENGGSDSLAKIAYLNLKTNTTIEIEGDYSNLINYHAEYQSNTLALEDRNFQHKVIKLETGEVRKLEIFNTDISDLTSIFSLSEFITTDLLVFSKTGNTFVYKLNLPEDQNKPIIIGKFGKVLNYNISSNEACFLNEINGNSLTSVNLFNNATKPINSDLKYEEILATNIECDNFLYLSGVFVDDKFTFINEKGETIYEIKENDNGYNKNFLISGGGKYITYEKDIYYNEKLNSHTYITNVETSELVEEVLNSKDLILI